MEQNQTIFQRLSNVFKGSGPNSISNDIITSPANSNDVNRVLFTTTDKAEYERKLKGYQQQKYMAYRWKKMKWSLRRMVSINGV